MSDSAEIVAARIQAEQAQHRLVARLHELQDRVAPRVLTRDALQAAKSKGADLAEDAVDAVRARPVAATGVVAAIALFLAREPLMDLAAKLVGGKSKKKSGKTVKKMESGND